jgi:2-polyprenyl-3-methyl-5-hydroxy-6-metoxy-1,4-benzoquinol methylase
MTTRWVSTTEPGHSRRYVERFRRLAAEGADLAGEARFLDAMIARGATVLDAGCGTGRVAAELAARGHRVVGVDADPVLIEAARTEHPRLPWVVADLSDVDLTGSGELPGPFDAAILAGNVMVYLAPGSEGTVLRNLAGGVRPDGIIVTGFATDREYGLPDFDHDARAAGLMLEHRFATWDLRPWRDDASFAVTVLRRPRPPEPTRG